MKTFKLFLLGILFVGLGAFYFYLNNQKNQTNSSSSMISSSLPSLDESVSSQIKTIEIYRPGSDGKANDITLKQNNNQWKITSFHNAPANNKNIQKLIDSFSKLEGQLRSTDSSTFSDFSIGDHQALHIIFKDENESELFHILVGKKGPGFNQSFIRKSESDNIFLVFENIYSLIGVWDNPEKAQPETNYWFDLKLFPFETKDIQFVHIQSSLNDWSVTKESDEENDKIWTIQGLEPSQFDTQKIKSWIKDFQNRLAIEIIKPNEETSLIGDPLSLKIETSEKSHQYQFWYEGEDFYLIAKNNDTNTYYKISSHAYDKITHAANEWLLYDSFSFSENKCTQIKINHPLKSIEFEKSESWQTKSPLPNFQAEEEKIIEYISLIKNWKPKDILTKKEVEQDNLEFSITLTFEDGSEETISIFKSIQYLNETLFPLTFSTTSDIYLAAKDQVGELIPSYDHWSNAPLITDDQLDEYHEVQIDNQGQVISFSESNEDNEEPDWYEELYDLLEEEQIQSIASESIQNISEEYNPIFLVLKFEEQDPIQMAFGKDPNKNTYYLEKQNPHAIYVINSEFYHFLSQLDFPKKENNEENNKAIEDATNIVEKVFENK